MSVGKTVAKNTLFSFIAKSSDLVINFFLGIALARGLGAEQYGMYAFLIWFLGLAGMIINLGAGEMAKRFIAEYQGRGNGNWAGVIKLALSIRIGAALIVVVLMAVLAKYIGQLFGYEDEQFYFILVALALLPQALNTILPSIYLGFQKVKYEAYLVLASNPLRAVIVVVLFHPYFSQLF